MDMEDGELREKYELREESPVSIRNPNWLIKLLSFRIRNTYKTAFYK
jgi:hypothetical protein